MGPVWDSNSKFRYSLILEDSNRDRSSSLLASYIRKIMYLTDFVEIDIEVDNFPPNYSLTLSLKSLDIFTDPW